MTSSTPLLPLLVLLSLLSSTALAGPTPVDLMAKRGLFGPDKVENATLFNALALATPSLASPGKCIVDGVVTTRLTHYNAIVAGAARLAMRAVTAFIKSPEQSKHFNTIAPFFYAKGSEHDSVAYTVSLAPYATADIGVQAVESGEHGITATPFTITNVDCKARTLAVSVNPGAGFAGAQVQVLQEQGITVVSDIDDTIKITEVLNKGKALQNTLINPFRATAGMVDLYTRFRSTLDAEFIYLSGSPHMLYTPLRDFIAAAGYPAGSMFLNVFGLELSDHLDFFKGTMVHKLKVLRDVIPKFNKRAYVLVGDSGEQDPETYGTIYREMAGTGVDIKCIYIRKVTGVDAAVEAKQNADARFAAAFTGVPPSKVFTFFNPAEIPATADIKNGKCF
ncbi:hypothetical protein BC828DRAFT_163803 [Blastocladiella britannica]|nr:hypothetical protein BC828DRAFT_163803 [Blastocladiella britannica]